VNITVFGGSTPLPGETAYEDARFLGKLLAQAGYTVLTGGYMGTMEAVSRGAVEAGGHVVGVTCAQIEVWRQSSANPWVLEEWRFDTLKERLYHLVEQCDAALALPGGVGTLAEIAVMWSQMQTGSMPPRPLILVGPGWLETFNALLTTQRGYISDEHQSLITFARNSEMAFSPLQSTLK
jgi:hypothetical protein